MDEVYEQEQLQEKMNLQEKVRTWAGLMGVPSALLIPVDVLVHGGLTPKSLTPIGLGGFVFALGTSQGIKAIEKWGHSEKLLLALCYHPKKLQWLNAFTGNYFTRQIYDLRNRKPYLFAQPHTTSPAEEETITEAEEEIVEVVEQTIHQQKSIAPETIAQVEKLVSLFRGRQTIDATSMIRRLTIDEIVEHTPKNEYWIYIGRSLTQPDHPAVPIGFYKKHLKIIGASQKGKSSMAAALLDIITRTHDRNHVRVALLDLENQTSNLFADLPHLATVTHENQRIKLHARNREQVLQYLDYVVRIMELRYDMTPKERARQPVLLVYVEEFLALKNYFKKRVDATKGDPQKNTQAKQDYANLIYCITEIALRGLKARVQFILCAQVDYRDDDLAEALTSITSGISFCVRPTAAQAAGFYRADLIKQNAIENAVGQFVAEMPDIQDLILAPDYDLEKRLLEWEKTHTFEQGMGSDDFCLPSEREEVYQEEEKQQVQRPEQSELSQERPAIHLISRRLQLAQDQLDVLNVCEQLEQEGLPASGNNMADRLPFGRDKALKIKAQLIKLGILQEDQDSLSGQQGIN